MSGTLMVALASASLLASAPPPEPPLPPPVPPAMDHGSMDHGAMDHGAMDHGAMGHEAMTHATTSASFTPGSGTSRLPVAEGHSPGFHAMLGDWMAMLHGTVSAQYTAASGPRGDAKLYSTSMVMGNLGRDTQWGHVQLRTMASHEPTLARDGYPNLFATGETAYGRPLVDRQHPHDLFMELAARIDLTVAPGTSLFLYGGPVGEPAIGPSVFMMRGSAVYNPEPPISHHWFDSTHIVYGVVTAGISARLFQLEGSAFRGREPDERRWNIEAARLDSWSVRATLTPSPRWAIQASYAAIAEPEAAHPGEDERRFTASAHYADGRRLGAMIAVSAKRRIPGETLTAWLAEANWNLDARNALFGRIENVANDELVPDHAAADHDHAYRVTKLQAGYARRIPLGALELALGASLALYARPGELAAAYGPTPVQGTMFARLRLGN